MRSRTGGLLILILLSFILIVPVVFAQDGKPIDQVIAEQKIPIGEQVASFYQWTLGISALVALGILVYAGLAYTTSGGNASRQSDAKQWIWNALIGLALLFGSYLILNTINPDLTKLQNIDLSQVEVGEAPQAAANLNLPELISNFYQWALGIGGLIALGILIFAGILYTISPGNSSRQGDAKTWIGSAIVGLVLLFGSYAILNTVNPDLTKLKFNLDKVEFNAPASSPAASSEPPKPGEKASLGIAEQIGNFYQWALGVGGLLALGVLIFGGILYIISAGNASRQDDAKSWLFGALMGILLLFGSYVILYTVNPELTKLRDLELIVNEAAVGPGTPFSVTTPVADNEFKKALLALLRQLDPVNANAWFAMIGCETAGTYSPTIENHSSNVPDPDGACGLFQMDCGCNGSSRYDCGKGDVNTQVSNAIALFHERGPGYWDAADGVCGDGYNGPSILK
ncbi:MAG: hypothetical protein HYS88_01980 [Candidatus Colwellbacteria bacterium]|nr:hypothetical protein [Candidatus Colwellbacteria bacterium]